MGADAKELARMAGVGRDQRVILELYSGSPPEAVAIDYDMTVGDVLKLQRDFMSHFMRNEALDAGFVASLLIRWIRARVEEELGKKRPTMTVEEGTRLLKAVSSYRESAIKSAIQIQAIPPEPEGASREVTRLMIEAWRRGMGETEDEVAEDRLVERARQGDIAVQKLLKEWGRRW